MKTKRILICAICLLLSVLTLILTSCGYAGRTVKDVGNVKDVNKIKDNKNLDSESNPVYDEIAVLSNNGETTEATQKENRDNVTQKVEYPTQKYRNLSTDNEFADSDLFGDKYLRFALNFAQNAMSSDGNQLVSPLSAAYCLAMVTNGASGETREQLEKVMGMDTNLLNTGLAAYAKNLECNTDKTKIRLADSIWIRDIPTLHVEPDFIQTNSKYYDSQAFILPFDDKAKDAINSWVDQNTEGLIKEILSEPIPDDAVMYLVNTLLFEAKWEKEYYPHNEFDSQFTNIDGSKTNIKMLSSYEKAAFFEGNGFTGFTKRYAGNYAFKAFLPAENIDIYDFAASFSYADWKASENKVTEFIDGQTVTIDANVRIPEFEFESDEIKLNDVLRKMGATNMFSPVLADFSALGYCDEGNIYCSKVAQKTHIKLDANGTKAGAATWTEMTCGAAAGMTHPITKSVNVFLDKPFLYAIVDTQTDLPLFIGIVSELN